MWSSNHIGHNSKVGDHNYISSHVIISGNCEIGNSCFFGVNSSVKDFTKIGNSCLISMGADIKSDLKQNSVALTKQNYDLINDEKIAEKLKARFKNVEKAIKIIPDGNTLLSKRPQLWLPRKWPTYFISSKNITLIDHKKKYKDFLFAVGTNVLGYSNTKVDRQVSKAISKGNMTSINAIEEYQLAEKLIQINPWAGMVKFARAGGDANAIAIRIARAASGKNNVAFCGYHGWHDWYVATNLTNKNGLNNHLIDGIKTYGVNKKLNKTIYPFLYNDFKNLKRLIENKKIGTVIMEVKRYEEPKNNFLKKIRDICNKKNIVLIFDECTTGFRQTFGGLYKEYSVIPDIIMYGKALGNGYAINAVVGKKSIMQHAKKSFISSTFWGERLGFVAGLASIEEMKRGQIMEASWKQAIM